MLAFYKEGKKFFDSDDYTKAYDIYTQGDKMETYIVRLLWHNV